MGVIITCEHAVDTIPTPYQRLFRHHQDILKTHRAIDFGALKIAKALSDSLKCPLIEATISRLLIDCNRTYNHRDCFSEFTKPLTKEEKHELYTLHYLPFRQKVDHLIQQTLDCHQKVLHFSIHSFTPCLNNEIRNAEIGFLYDPSRNEEKKLSRDWKTNIEKITKDYRIRMNYPYRGTADGLVTALRKNYQSNQYVGIEVESNQAITKDRSTLNKLIETLVLSCPENKKLAT